MYRMHRSWSSYLNEWNQEKEYVRIFPELLEDKLWQECEDIVFACTVWVIKITEKCLIKSEIFWCWLKYLILLEQNFWIGFALWVRSILRILKIRRIVRISIRVCVLWVKWTWIIILNGESTCTVLLCSFSISPSTEY